MSGGHFDYKQFDINYIVEEIENVIYHNEDETLDEWGNKKGNFFNNDTIEKFKQAVIQLKKAQIMATRIDWLLSGDDGEDTFHDRWNDELKDL
jgi:hypothetical protein